jgi:glycolate oxidase FAD binding subunit
MAYHYLCSCGAGDYGPLARHDVSNNLTVWTPQTPEELAEALERAARHSRTILLRGNGSKNRMAGSLQVADEEITTAALARVLEYEPADLTISVEAGLPWKELTRVLAQNRQMVPLDPPFNEQATVGGVIGANSSGPRRRLYGTARDMVIGMRFATLQGKLVQSGGMVVKNVAGLDMAKLMIGSFGTLAAVAVVNFKLTPMPETERSFLLPFDTAAAAVAARNRVLAGGLQPAAIDLWNPAAGKMVGQSAWMLAVRAGGNRAVVERYERDLAGLADGKAFEGEEHNRLWRAVEEFTPAFLAANRDGTVVRASCTLKEVEAVMASFEGPALARAGSGVCYGYFAQCDAGAEWLKGAQERGWRAVMESAPEHRKEMLDLWPGTGDGASKESRAGRVRDLETMRRVKTLFDPSNLLNRGRLYGRI